MIKNIAASSYTNTYTYANMFTMTKEMFALIKKKSSLYGHNLHNYIIKDGEF